MTTTDIGQLIKTYCNNMDRQSDLDHALLDHCPKDEWIARLRDRAAELKKISEENEELLKNLHALLEEDLSEDESLALYETAVEMYQNDYDDYVVLFPILMKLEKIYENGNDYEKLIFIYRAAFYEENEIKNRGSGRMHLSDKYLRKIFALKDHYTELPKDSRRGFWVAWYNYVVMDTEDVNFDINRSYFRHLEFLDFWNSEAVQNIDKDNEDFKALITQLDNDWMCVEEFLDDANDEVKKYLYDYSGQRHEEEMKTAKSLVDYNDRVYGLYLHTRIESGEETYASALEKYLEYYKACLEKYGREGAQGQEEQHFLNNGPVLMINFIKKIPECERNREIISYLISTTEENLFNKYTNFPSVFINDVLARWCSKTLEYFDTLAEKEEWILHLIVRRQLPTYLHSVMVAKLAGEFAESILRNKPDYFDALPVKENIPEYLRHCGLFHDVGKTRIADIINLQGRKLGDDEFEAIRKHPEYGTLFLANDDDLKIYSDVAVGHHRFYDGTGGYPDYYIPGKSPFQSAVDIITVCDCLDAATDCYGRNYKSAKTTEEIFSELKKFAGVRYNPVLVDLISTDTLLKDRIENLLGPGRGEIMYEAYHKTFE